MSVEDAEAIWSELDHYRQGFVSANTIQRWLEDEGNFSIPLGEVHYLYDAFKCNEYQQRITMENFVQALAGPLLQEEEGEDQNAEDEGPNESDSMVKDSD